MGPLIGSNTAAWYDFCYIKKFKIPPFSHKYVECRIVECNLEGSERALIAKNALTNENGNIVLTFLIRL